MDWTPIKLSTHFRTYTFGERLIPERIGKRNVPEGVVAESWEISDQRDARATITAGPYAGRLLNDLVRDHPAELVGAGWHGPHFPLLCKFLDASHMLPVHLHGNDETARLLYNDANGKSEAWHILWCAPGASILAGVNSDLTGDDLRAAWRSQDYDAILDRYPISGGDTVYVPGGVLHSFGPDTLIFEIQQTSDIGQHVMPQDMHGNPIDEATREKNYTNTLAELRTSFMPKPHPGLEHPGAVADNRYVVCCAGPHFALERWLIRSTHAELAHPDQCRTLSNVGGEARLVYAAGETVLARGESCILPAALGEVQIVPGAEPADLIVCYIPELDRDIVQPLRAAGHADDTIKALGEIPI